MNIDKVSVNTGILEKPSLKKMSKASIETIVKNSRMFTSEEENHKVGN